MYIAAAAVCVVSGEAAMFLISVVTTVSFALQELVSGGRTRSQARALGFGSYGHADQPVPSLREVVAPVLHVFAVGAGSCCP